MIINNWIFLRLNVHIVNTQVLFIFKLVTPVIVPQATWSRLNVPGWKWINPLLIEGKVVKSPAEGAEKWSVDFPHGKIYNGCDLFQVISDVLDDGEEAVTAPESPSLAPARTGMPLRPSMLQQQVRTRAWNPIEEHNHMRVTASPKEGLFKTKTLTNLVGKLGRISEF